MGGKDCSVRFVYIGRSFQIVPEGSKCREEEEEQWEELKTKELKVGEGLPGSVGWRVSVLFTNRETLRLLSW